MDTHCEGRATNGDCCDKGRDHSGPHIHFGANLTHAWGLWDSRERFVRAQ
jgi:hypothetical protein